MKGIWKRLGFRRPDEMERFILFKAQRNAYLFLIAALFLWTVYESCRVYIHHSRLNLMPCLLLVGASLIQGFSQLVMTRSAVKDDDDSYETGPLVRIVVLACGGGGARAYGRPDMKNRIKELRRARGLRQEDLAAALGVSRQTIIAVENNKYDPTLGLAMRLARRLDTTVEELFTLEDDV